LACFPPTRQHRPPCPRRGVGQRWAATGDAGPLLRRLCRPLPNTGTSRSGSRPRRRDPETSRTAIASRQDQDRRSSTGAEGFDFLGFHHRMVKSWKRPGRYWLHKWPSPRAMASIRGKVRDLTAPSRVGLDLGQVVDDPNPVLRGWGAYFRQGNSSAKFGAIDAYVHERVARLASRKHGLRGFHWSDRFTWEWLGNLGICRLTGTVRYPTAHALR